MSITLECLKINETSSSEPPYKVTRRVHWSSQIYSTRQKNGSNETRNDYHHQAKEHDGNDTMQKCPVTWQQGHAAPLPVFA